MYSCPMREKTVHILKKFTTATSFIATFVDLTFEGFIIKSSFGQDSFQIWILAFATNKSSVLSISSFMAGLPSKIDLLSWTMLNIFG